MIKSGEPFSNLVIALTPYYRLIVLISSALLSNLFVYPEKKTDGLGQGKNIINIKLYIGYAIGLFFNLCVYSWVKSGKSIKLSVEVFCSTLKAIAWSQWVEIAIIPIIIAAVIYGIRNKYPIFKTILIILLSAVLFVSPLLTEYNSVDDNLETLIISRFRTTNYPYITKIYDTDGFRRNISDGYGVYTDDKKKENEVEENPEPVNNKDFESLVNAARYYAGLDDKKAKQYLNAAYEIYQEKGENAFDAHSIGTMWFYKGWLERSAESYAKAGVKYSSIGEDIEYYNAALSYQHAYEIDALDEYAEKAIENIYFYCQRYGADEFIQERIEDILLIMQGTYLGEIEHLNYYTKQYPNSAAIQMVGLLRSIQIDAVDGYQKNNIKKLLGNAKYELCPKLLIAAEYINNSYANADNIFKLYQEHPEYFEPEDIINLGWLLYMNGQYSRAYNLAITMYSTDAYLEGVVSLLCELYLQQPDLFSSDNIRRIQRDMNSVMTDIANWYSREGYLRISIANVLMAGTMSMNPTDPDIVDLSTELFNGDSVDDLIIQAALEYRNEQYGSCLEKCEVLEEIKGITDSDLRRVLFIKADTLIALAEAADDHDSQQEYYIEACIAMEKVRAAVEDDYLESLRKLKDIYSNMDGDHYDDIQQINEILQNTV